MPLHLPLFLFPNRCVLSVQLGLLGVILSFVAETSLWFSHYWSEQEGCVDKSCRIANDTLKTEVSRIWIQVHCRRAWISQPAYQAGLYLSFLLRFGVQLCRAWIIIPYKAWRYGWGMRSLQFVNEFESYWTHLLRRSLEIPCVWRGN